MINTLTNNPTTGAVGTSVGSSASAAGSNGQSLSQGDFLSLLVTQMQNQDPTSPMDSSQMVSQMAQISQVQATQDMQSTLTGLASTLSNSGVSQSASLIGHSVVVPASSGTLSNGSLTGAVDVPTSGADVKVQIVDPSTGKVVKNLDLGAQNAGMVPFSWDGKGDDGSTLPSGQYGLAAAAGGTRAQIYASGQVVGVGNASDGSGTYLQLGNGLSTPLSKVVQVN